MATMLDAPSRPLEETRRNSLPTLQVAPREVDDGDYSKVADWYRRVAEVRNEMRAYSTGTQDIRRHGAQESRSLLCTAYEFMSNLDGLIVGDLEPVVESFDPELVKNVRGR